MGPVVQVDTIVGAGGGDCRLLAQVDAVCGAGGMLLWRGWTGFLVQVRFLGGDLRRKMGFYAFQWRRSCPFFHTCVICTSHLRQLYPTPAPAVPHTCASCTTCTPTCITYPTCATYPTRIPHLLQSPRTPAPLRCECGVAGMRGRERAKTGLKCHKLEKGSKGGNVSQNGGEGGPGAGKFVDLEDLQK